MKSNNDPAVVTYGQRQSPESAGLMAAAAAFPFCKPRIESPLTLQGTRLDSHTHTHRPHRTTCTHSAVRTSQLFDDNQHTHTSFPHSATLRAHTRNQSHHINVACGRDYHYLAMVGAVSEDFRSAHTPCKGLVPVKHSSLPTLPPPTHPPTPTNQPTTWHSVPHITH